MTANLIVIPYAVTLAETRFNNHSDSLMMNNLMINYSCNIILTAFPGLENYSIFVVVILFYLFSIISWFPGLFGQYFIIIFWFLR